MEKAQLNKGQSSACAIEESLRGGGIESNRRWVDADPRGGVDQRRRPDRGALKLLVFFAFLGAAMLVADSAINFGMRHIKTSSFGVSNRIMAGRVGADIVISGSSRALTHYDPRIIEAVTGLSAFNIGVNGSQTDMQLAVLQAYLRHNRKPRLLIHNLDLFSFTTSREIYNPAQYIPYLQEESIYAGVRRVYPDAWKWHYLPLYGYAVEDMNLNWLLGVGALVGIQPREDHFKGYLPRFRSWTDDFRRFRESNPKGVVIPVEERGVEDFTRVIELCATRSIPVLAVYSPEYYEMQAIERNRAEILSKMKRITDSFGVPIWDYSDSELSRERSRFYNSQHLNAEGATIFSTDLAHRLVSEGTSAFRISLDAKR
jgi:hypothetical protein